MSSKSKKPFYYLFFIILLIMMQFTGCKWDRENKSEVVPEQQVAFRIETSSDSVEINEYVRSFAFLEKSYFKNSGVIVYMENDDGNRLNGDLSNEYDINMEIFLNLRHDTVNQKWMEGNDLDKTVVFGRKYNSTGNKTIRGYVLEYYDKDSPIDSVFKSKKVKKYYFEKEIYIDSIKE